MKPNLVQCQVRAIFVGLLWWLPFLIFSRYVQEFMPGCAVLVFLFCFPALVAFVVAVLTGAFDLLAIVSVAIPAAFYFVTSTYVDWDWHSRHVGTFLGPSMISGALESLTVVALAFVGIGVKRALMPDRRLELSPREVCSLHRCLCWDLGLIVGIAVALLGVDGAIMLYESVPPS